MKNFVRNDILKDGIVNEENLDILCEQVIENSCYDKVGIEFYSIDKSMSYTDLNRSPEIISDWLDHLETLRVTSKNIGYINEDISS